MPDYERIVRPIVDELLTETKTDLVELRISPQGVGAAIRIVLDQPGGIGLETCARFNRELLRRLESQPTAGGHFSVEVSSPGIDRPLRGAADYGRVAGKMVKVTVKGERSRQTVVGIVEAFDPEGVQLRPEGTAPVYIRYADIIKAQLEFRW